MKKVIKTLNCKIFTNNDSGIQENVTIFKFQRLFLFSFSISWKLKMSYNVGIVLGVFGNVAEE